ncbi:Glycosyltransferase family 15 protein [Mycena sanguinolenta]|uniref:Glycosyltransferase family 15 protein n=1 Tax=Mycena sanguinolenta TaxID=230812 RepID=A0A8H6YZF2_9AGAR|nr:Glycosyltransferase family 15 protein [Mycena sanguinolenta]
MSEASGSAFEKRDLTNETINEKRRACDRCRRLKRRCDGAEICGQCSANGVVCARRAPALVRTVFDIQRRSYTRDYVESLKLRLQNVEQELHQPGQHLVSGLLKGLIKPIPPPHPSDSGPHDLAASFQKLFLDDPPPDPGFQGESSVSMMVKAAVAIKPDRPSTRRRTPGPNPWILNPWDPHSSDIRHLTFPDSHLLSTLISLYFTHVDIFIPILHRSNFEDAVSNGFHTSREDFASLLLLVCALGSLYLPDSTASSEGRVKLAWTWYDQVELCGHALRRPPTTYDLQAYCLAGHFLVCCANPRLSWTMVGFGLRIAQDIGTPRRNLSPTISTGEELEKRATWQVNTHVDRDAADQVIRALILLDAQLACSLGRLTALNPFDLDIGLPSELPLADGPQHTPSILAFFNCVVGLYRILHFLLKNLYSTSRLYTASGIGDLRGLAVELDLTLNKWFSSIPPHLIWDPERLDRAFFDQSAALYCFYDYIRMLLHRPFILPRNPTEPPDLRAMRICTKAACACISVADTHRRRRPDCPLFLSQDPLFTAAMVLIINMWAYPQHGDEQVQNLANVRIVLDIFKSQQTWQAFTDSLSVHSDPRGSWPSSGYFITVIERLLALDHTAAEQPEAHSDTTSSPGSISGTGTEGLMGHQPESWTVLAQAWLAGAPLDRHSLPQTLPIPPVFVGGPRSGSDAALSTSRSFGFVTCAALDLFLLAPFGDSPAVAMLNMLRKRRLGIIAAAAVVLYYFLGLRPGPTNRQLLTDHSAHDSRPTQNLYEPPYRTGIPEKYYAMANTSERASAVIVILARNRDLAGVLSSMIQFESKFNHKFGYPYVFLNEVPFTEEFKRNTSVATAARVQFGLVPPEHWYQPDWIDEARASAVRQRMGPRLYGGRFLLLLSRDCLIWRAKIQTASHIATCVGSNPGLFFFRHELLKPYKYYWRYVYPPKFRTCLMVGRVEPDVKFYCDIDFDPFRFMEGEDKKYAFTISFPEFKWTIKGLWPAVKYFMKANPELISPDNAMGMLTDRTGTYYNRCHFWSNFEIASLELWRSEAYLKFFEFLDSRGCTQSQPQRWGDAPIHSFGAALFARKDQIVRTHLLHKIYFTHESLLRIQHFFNEIGERRVCI